MIKTKAQLRAEAVERLRNFVSSDEGDGYYWDVTRALLGKRPTEYDSSDELLSALIDLLTDNCGPCYSCAKLAELMAENNALRGIVGDLKVPTDPGEASMMSVDAFIEKQTEHESQDTREKLEDEIRSMRKRSNIDFFHSDVWVEAPIGVVLKWLDRQAAITHAEVNHDAGIAAHEAGKILREQIDELREDVAERDDVIAVLKSENADLQAKLDELAERKCPGYEPERHYCRYHHQDFELNHQTVSRLKMENAELSRDLGECMAENEKLKAGLLPQGDDEGLA